MTWNETQDDPAENRANQGIPRRTRKVMIIGIMVLLAVTIGSLILQLLEHYDVEYFVAELRTAGAAVELHSEPDRDLGWFPVPPRIVRVNGHVARVFEFSSNAQALWASCHVLSNGQSIAPMDGTPGSSIDWSYPGPSWYRRGQLIVIYSSSDPGTDGVVEKLLGSSFTGGVHRGAPCGLPFVGRWL